MEIFLILFTYARGVLALILLVPWTILYSSISIVAGVSGQTRLADRAIHQWAHGILWIAGVRFDIRGEENLPKSGGGIIAFNHQSHLDIPVLMASTLKTIRFGAKIELFMIPLFGAAMRAIGTLPIARDNRSEVMRIYKEAEVRFRENTLFVLAPEGTRQKEPIVGRFKKGPFAFAINAQVPLIPVVIKGAYEVLPKGELFSNIGRLTGVIHVHYLPPISTKGMTLENVDSLLEQVRAQMVEVYDRIQL